MLFLLKLKPTIGLGFFDCLHLYKCQAIYNNFSLQTWRMEGAWKAHGSHMETVQSHRPFFTAVISATSLSPGRALVHRMTKLEGGNRQTPCRSRAEQLAGLSC